MAPAHPKRPHLKAWREHFGRTQEWLAEQIGKHHTSVHRQEQQVAGVDDATFAAIARAYGISVAELSGAPSEAAKARELSRVLAAIRTLDDRKLSLVADLAEQLAPKE